MSAASWPLQQWLAFLETLSPSEIVLGLERVREMLQRLRPRMPQTVFLVAGTNGKGSSVAMLEALLRRTGQRVGCYTSPHLLRYNERIRIDATEVSDAQIVAAFAAIEALRADLPLTYFEFGTLAALHVFAQAEVDIAVLEVGMGGRLDAVNAVEPTASLICSIALDHCAWLGDTLDAIAVEKAGVMREARPVVYASPDRPSAIDRCAQQLGASLIAAQRDYSWQAAERSWSWQGVSHELHDLCLPGLRGAIQIQNAAGVLALLEASGFHELLDAAPVNAALSSLRVAGRLQTVGDRWLLDVAHNPAAASALTATLAEHDFAGRTTVILGMLDDKDVEGVVRPLRKFADNWIAVTACSPRAIPAAELARRVANETNSACLIAPSIAAALERAELLCGGQDRVLITGSFYVVGAALAALQS